jgi:hypothetical protein
VEGIEQLTSGRRGVSASLQSDPGKLDAIKATM